MARFFRKRLAEKLNRDGFLIRNLVSFHRKYDRSEEIDSRMIFIFLKFEILWKGKREKLGEEMQSSHTPSFNADARNFLSFFSFFFFCEESGIRSAGLLSLGSKYSKNLKDSGEISFPRRDDNTPGVKFNEAGSGWLFEGA